MLQRIWNVLSCEPSTCRMAGQCSLWSFRNPRRQTVSHVEFRLLNDLWGGRGVVNGQLSFNFPKVNINTRIESLHFLTKSKITRNAVFLSKPIFLNWPKKSSQLCDGSDNVRKASESVGIKSQVIRSKSLFIFG